MNDRRASAVMLEGIRGELVRGAGGCSAAAATGGRYRRSELSVECTTSDAAGRAPGRRCHRRWRPGVVPAGLR
ncbi:MAG: hypothetical protein R3F14_39830 [Polyangiaceae bacterium]